MNRLEYRIGTHCEGLFLMKSEMYVRELLGIGPTNEDIIEKYYEIYDKCKRKEESDCIK